MEIVVKRNDRQMMAGVKQLLSDIYMKITWREIASDYFGKSPSWLYHKLDGIDGNGGRGGFTKEELSTLKMALVDLADKIRTAAGRL
ncbi:MAG: DUF5053 domain-containing protein [Bacteroidales bacterium]|nr:DUF5053 domain-containing protein [Bacteroidales bacterium]